MKQHILYDKSRARCLILLKSDYVKRVMCKSNRIPKKTSQQIGIQLFHVPDNLSSIKIWSNTYYMISREPDV